VPTGAYDLKPGRQSASKYPVGNAFMRLRAPGQGPFNKVNLGSQPGIGYRPLVQPGNFSQPLPPGAPSSGQASGATDEVACSRSLIASNAGHGTAMPRLRPFGVSFNSCGPRTSVQGLESISLAPQWLVELRHVVLLAPRTARFTSRGNA
jgi:hypothetical protein